MPSQVRNSANAMPKKNPENARTTPAAPKAPAPMPAFLADFPTSALASSTSARISVDMSAIALCTSVPTDGSAVPADTVSGAGDTLWATGAPPSFGAGLIESCPTGAGSTHVGPCRPPLARGVSVLGRRGGQLLLDQVHHGVVGQGGD